MDSVTEENVAHILKEKADTQTELEQLIATTPSQMWLKELDILEKEYANYKKKREKIQSGSTTEKNTAGTTKKIIKKLK